MRGTFHIVLISAALLIPALIANAHCDTIDGPVIMAAQTALENGDFTPVLKWIKPDVEPELRSVFMQALAVRKSGGEAQTLADHYFFEALVRLHRAGEGAPYTGVKPAGAQEPAIMAADHALETASVNELLQEITTAVTNGIQTRFNHALETKQHADHNVEAGREFVAAYVEYVHFVERLHNDATTSAAHHEAATPAVEHNH